MGVSDLVELQLDIEAVALRILAHGGGKSSLAHLPLLPRSAMRIAMGDPIFRAELFRLVDVFPRLRTNDEVFAHALQYLGSTAAARGFIAAGLRCSSKIPFAQTTLARVVKSNLNQVASLFIAGTTPESVAELVSKYRIMGIATTVDVLGEKTLTDSEAHKYVAEIQNLVLQLKRKSDTWTKDEANRQIASPAMSVSIKPTALSPHYSSLGTTLGLSEAKKHLEGIFSQGTDTKILFFLDMEDHDVKDLTLRLVEELAVSPSTSTIQFGTVIQAYLKSSLGDLARLIKISRHRVKLGWPPLWIRLVKGAYFDTEMAKATGESWEQPTFTSKEETDYNFERCTDVLLQNYGAVRPAFGTHNLRSIAYVIAKARALGLDEQSYEIEMLYGMAEYLAKAVRKEIPNVRMYLPLGDLIPGMSYLVRRLIENTSNQGILSQGLVGKSKSELTRLLQPPQPKTFSKVAEKTVSTEPFGPYQHHGSLKFHDESVRIAFASKIASLRDNGIQSILGTDVFGQDQIPMVIGGRRISTASQISSANPARALSVVARSASASPSDVLLAIGEAKKAQPSWGNLSAASRAEVLMRAASWIDERRMELAALEVLEVGKPWREADGDIAEALDFLHFYARAMVDLAQDDRLASPPGETNRRLLKPRGVTAVISPWNFPMAIPMGMVSAALVAGNSVILKPAEQAPATAFAIFAAFEAAGLPRGVLTFLPGIGEVVGPTLVLDPRVSTIAFTGSYAVGTQIIASASIVAPGQIELKRVIAEMGGKNPIIVDADADLDQVVPGVIYSAFGFAGQKCSACSRLIVDASIADEVIERLKGSMATLVIGDPVHPEVQVGPVIDQEAKSRVERLIGFEGAANKVFRFQGELPKDGFFVAPTLVIDPPLASDVLVKEIFGPVLCIEIAKDINEAVQKANATDYALTAGIFSRSPETIRFATRTLVAGNIYVNRHITGAVPGRQPFGGFQHSGIGSKAGSRDYVLQFCNVVVVTENTQRQGLVPEIN